jgi:dipeptidyl aminopeptidase/acylaminoacyl peptidase
VTRVSGGIDLFELTANGDAIVYITSTDVDTGPWSSLRTQFSNAKYGTRRQTRTSFHRVDLRTWRTTPLATFTGAVDAFAISPDEKRIAMVTAPDGAVVSMEGGSELTILDIATGATFDLPDDLWRSAAPSPYGRLAAPQWSRDGGALAFAIGFDAYPSEVFVAEWKESTTPIINKVLRPGTVSLHGGVDGGITLHWKGDSRDLCFLADDRGRVKIYCARNATESGSVDCLIDGDMVIDTFSWDREGRRLTAIKGSPDEMHDVFLWEAPKGDWKQLTQINAHTQDWKLPKISIVRWSGAGGKPVEGLLELPADYQPGTPLPLIVNLHGGPTSAWTYNMVFGYFGSVLFAGHGYAYFSPNYRGSTGYGDAFMTYLVGRENDV